MSNSIIEEYIQEITFNKGIVIEPEKAVNIFVFIPKNSMSPTCVIHWIIFGIIKQQVLK